MTFERSGIVYVVDPTLPGGCRIATIKEFFEYHAKKKGVTYDEVVKECYEQGRSLAQKRKWGAMPCDYDPLKDESHPGRRDLSADD